MYWLGIDIGSISTDLVLIDKDCNVADQLYLKTKSKPLDAVRRGLKIFGNKYDKNDIKATGLTGSGRALGAAVVGGDIVKNEITAHARAVAQIDPEIRTVIEIGGQDSKIIIMEDGMVADFAMNTVCAAGTGSFLDRQASRMGIDISDLGKMAAEAERCSEIAGRCAVFAESDMIHKQQMGVKDDELMAGMCKALALSYMSNVAKGKKIRSKICFQGGVASNEGMKKAFEQILGEEVIVPDHHKIMGAFGAAILAKEKNFSSTKFKGFDAGNLNLTMSDRKCSGCSNQCTVTEIRADGVEYGCFGEMCGKYSRSIT